jgi:hypothetical protein
LKLKHQPNEEGKEDLNRFDLREAIVDLVLEWVEIRDERQPQDAHRERRDDLLRRPGAKKHERASEDHLPHRAAKFEPVKQSLVLIVERSKRDTVAKVLVQSLNCCVDLRWSDHAVAIELDCGEIQRSAAVIDAEQD